MTVVRAAYFTDRPSRVIKFLTRFQRRCTSKPLVSPPLTLPPLLPLPPSAATPLDDLSLSLSPPLRRGTSNVEGSLRTRGEREKERERDPTVVVLSVAINL